MEDRRLSHQAQTDQDLAALRDDIDLLTYKIAHLEAENRALKWLVSIAYLLAFVLPIAAYYAAIR